MPSNQCIGHLRSAMLCIAAFICHVAAAEDVHVRNRDALALALRESRPGTTILLAPGTYRGGLSYAGLRGAKERPIVIAGADPQNPPLIEGGGSGFHFSSPEFLELRDLVFAGATGNGLNIDDGGSIETPAHDVVLRNVQVRDVGPAGNRDGIKLSGVVDFRVEECRVERWGNGGSAIDMVGCSRGVIERSTFAEGVDGANGVQAKGGSREIVVRRCRFENAGGRAVNVGGSTGLAYFRPKPQGFEAKDITVEDCEFFGGMSAVSFVGIDGALVQHNTIYRPRRWAVRILQENTDPQFVPSRNGRFIKNVIAFRAEECRQVINIGPNTAPETFEFAGNHWHCLDRPADTQRLVQLPVKETDGVIGAAPAFADAEGGDLSLKERRPNDPGARSATGRESK
jgi:hypothetical protein